MIPVIPNGELKRVIEAKAKKADLKVKIVEKAGPKLGGYLRKFDKTNDSEPCTEKDCMICINTTKKSRKWRMEKLASTDTQEEYSI